MQVFQLVTFFSLNSLRLVGTNHYPNYKESSNDTAIKLTRGINLRFNDCDLATNGAAYTTMDKSSFRVETC